MFGVVIVTLGFGFHSAGASVGEDPPYAWLLRVCFVLCGSILLVTTWRPEPAAIARLRMLEFAAYYLSVTIAGLLLSAWLAGQPGQDFLGMRPAITGYFVVLTIVWLLLAGSLRRGANTAIGTLPAGTAVKLAATWRQNRAATRWRRAGGKATPWPPSSGLIGSGEAALISCFSSPAPWRPRP